VNEILQQMNVLNWLGCMCSYEGGGGGVTHKLTELLQITGIISQITNFQQVEKKTRLKHAAH
jgi:hypothetical protein